MNFHFFFSWKLFIFMPPSFYIVVILFYTLAITLKFNASRLALNLAQFYFELYFTIVGL